MGYYIQTPDNTNKAEQLLRLYPETRELQAPWFDPTGKLVTLCVVQGTYFDAVAIAYSQAELDEFAAPEDTRPKRWLAMPRELVEALCPAVRERITV